MIDAGPRQRPRHPPRSVCWFTCWLWGWRGVFAVRLLELLRPRSQPQGILSERFTDSPEMASLPWAAIAHSITLIAGLIKSMIGDAFELEQLSYPRLPVETFHDFRMCARELLCVCACVRVNVYVAILYIYSTCVSVLLTLWRPIVDNSKRQLFVVLSFLSL